METLTPRPVNTSRQLFPILLRGAACVALSAVLSACGGTTSTNPGPTVRVIAVPGLGRILQDNAGYVLYIFLPDNRGPSVCLTVCAEQWPPLVLPPTRREPTAGPGVEDKLLGTTRRPDGALQVTYNGWPLYTYIGDTAGVVTGQGESMGAWYAISTDGVIDRNLPATPNFGGSRR
jgi:predicted lipoprotein with Yx(FWY)xxD motif